MEKLEKKVDNLGSNNDSINNLVRFFIYFSAVLGVAIVILLAIVIMILYFFIDWIVVGLILMVALSIIHTLY